MVSDPSIEDLLRDIESHEYILPEFQRGYVWSQKQVKEYLTSLYRGYPTGTFLVWKTPEVQKVRGSNVNQDSKYFKLILDGQQRLTSLYALFKGKPPEFYEGEKLFFNLYFNVETEEFTYYMEKMMKGNMEWIPVTEFLQNKDVGKFISQIESPDAKLYYTNNIGKLVKLNDIRNYTYHLTEISELNIEEVVTIFNLVNSSGTPLSKADLALAHICSYWPEARDIFKEFHQKFKAINFDFGLDFLTVCISAVAVDSVLFEKSFYSASEEIIKNAWEKVVKSLEYIVNVLKTDGNIDSNSDIKTPFVLTPIVYYLSKNNLNFSLEKEKKLFLYWMYNALMWGRYSGRTYQTLQSDIVNLKNNNKVESLIDSIRKQRGGNLEVTSDDLTLEGVNSRFFPIAHIVARSLNAIDWFNGVKLSYENIGPDYKIHIHHIFPQAVLYKSGYISTDTLDKRKVNEIANLAFITRVTNLKISSSKPLDYLRDIDQKYPHALEKQFMPSKDYWQLNRYEDFLQERRKIISKSINKFLGSLVDDKEVLETLSTENIIALGENEMIEFKSAFKWDYNQGKTDKKIEHSCIKTINAFLNYNGGTLYIGVKDDGEIIGIQKDIESINKQNIDGYELYISQVINNSFGKEYRKYIHVNFENTKKGIICVIRVEKSNKPIFMNFEGVKEFYIRSGNASQSLDLEETSVYIKSHWEE